MPRLPALRISALQRLDSELRFEPPEAARRKLERAEALALELLSNANDAEAPSTIPEAYVLFRLTGLRIDSPSGDAGELGLIVREALIGDLGALVDRWSDAARIGPESCKGWLSIDELLAKWRISRKTLERLRRKGLLARRVSLGGGRSRVVFSPKLVQTFEKAHRAELERAAGFTRIDAKLRRAIITDARAMLAEKPVSLAACAKTLAGKHRRSIHAVRDLLTSTNGDGPVFATKTAIDGRDRSRLEGAVRRGVPIARGSKALGRARASGYRMLAKERLHRLRGIDIWIPPASDALLDSGGAVERVLSTPLVCAGLGERWMFPIGHVLLGPNEGAAMSRRDEATLAEAYGLLRARAVRGIAGLPSTPSAIAIDAIETDLLWGARIKAKLVLAHLPLLVRTVHGLVGSELASLSPSARESLAAAAVEALITAAEKFDADKGGRLAGAAGVAIGRAVGRLIKDRPELVAPPALSSASASRLATRRVSDAAIIADDFTRRVCDWQAFLDLHGTMIANAANLDEPYRRIVELKFGLAGERPLRAAEIAEALKLPVMRVSQRLRRGIAELERAARGVA